jgi:hypothetical protein
VRHHVLAQPDHLIRIVGPRVHLQQTPHLQRGPCACFRFAIQRLCNSTIASRSIPSTMQSESNVFWSRRSAPKSTSANARTA